MKIPFAVIAVACLVCALAGASPAYADSLTVLDVQSGAVGESYARSLTNALRRAADRNGSRELVHSRRRSALSQLLIVFDCDRPSPSCMTEIGRNLESDRLIYGSLAQPPGPSNGEYMVTLRYFDVNAGAVEQTLRETLSRSLSSGELEDVARRLFAALTGRGAAEISVLCNIEGAEVLVDGEAAGVVEGEPLVIQDLSAGEVVVEVRHPDYLPAEHRVTTTPGATVEVEVHLEPLDGASNAYDEQGDEPSSPGAVATSGEGHRDRRSLAWVGWSALGLSVLAGGLGLWNSLEVHAINQDPVWQAVLRDRQGNICEYEDAAATTDTEYIMELCDKGRTFNVVQFVLYGVGAVALGVGVGLLLRDAQIRRRAQARTWSIALTPPTTSGGGGVLSVAF